MTKISAMGDPTQHHQGASLKKTPIKIIFFVMGILLLLVLYVIASKGQQKPQEPNAAEETQSSRNNNGNSAEIPQALQGVGQTPPSIPAADEPPPRPAPPDYPTSPDYNYSENSGYQREAPPSLEEQLRIQQMQRLADFRTQQHLAALVADTEIKINDSITQSMTKEQTSSMSENDSLIMQAKKKMTELQQNLGGNPFISSAMAEPMMQQADPNGQAQKAAFLGQQRSDDYLGYTRTEPLSPYELSVGTLIPATLITGMNSDIPGAITAQVSQDVYDSATGKHLLIPQGAKLYGVYDSNVSYGQSRGVSAWTRINYPDGTRLNLAGMGGIDTEGYSGFADEVDNHYWKTFGNAFLLGMISGVAQAGISEDSQNGDTKSAIADGVTQQFAQTGSTLIQKNLDVQPTIKIRPGYKFNIMVNKDIMLTPYNKRTR